MGKLTNVNTESWISWKCNKGGSIIYILIKWKKKTAVGAERQERKTECMNDLENTPVLP